MHSSAIPHVRGKARWRAGVADFLSRERGRTALASVLLVINVVLLIAYLFISYKGIFHSDSAVKNLLAQEMHDTARFFPPDWNYVNKDLMVLFGQLGIFPLLFFFDNSYTLYAISSSVVALLILASAGGFTGLLDGRPWQRVLAVAVLAGGISGGVAEDVFGQAAYGAVVMFTCLVTVLAWKVMSSAMPRRALWCALLFGLVSLITWSNPQRSAASYLLPLFCGLATYAWGGEWTQRLHRCVPVVVSALGGFAAGAVLSVLTLTGVNNNAGAGAARWDGRERGAHRACADGPAGRRSGRRWQRDHRGRTVRRGEASGGPGAAGDDRAKDRGDVRRPRRSRAFRGRAAGGPFTVLPVSPGHDHHSRHQ
jgi:hypothetical protein